MKYKTQSDPELCKAYGTRWREACAIRARILNAYGQPNLARVTPQESALLSTLAAAAEAGEGEHPLFGGLDELPTQDR